MKKCSICKTEKEPVEYNKNKCKKDGLSTVCRDCSGKRSRQYYQDNLIEHRKTVRERNVRTRERNQQLFLEYLKQQKCTDCGTTDYRVFEFDHIGNDKRCDVSILVGGGWKWETIKQEIDKCEVVCCNCHRIRTFTRQGSYKISSWKVLGTQ